MKELLMKRTIQLVRCIVQSVKDNSKVRFPALKPIDGSVLCPWEAMTKKANLLCVIGTELPSLPFYAVHDAQDGPNVLRNKKDAAKKYFRYSCIETMEPGPDERPVFRTATATGFEWKGKIKGTEVWTDISKDEFNRWVIKSNKEFDDTCPVYSLNNLLSIEVADMPSDCWRLPSKAKVEVKASERILPDNCIVFDTETGGLKSEVADIVSISIVSAKDNFYTKVLPVLPVQEGAAKVNGYTIDGWKDAPSFRSIADEVFNRMNNKIWIGQNVQFDVAFINAAFRNIGKEAPKTIRCIDTIDAAKEMNTKKKLGINSFKLTNLCQMFGIVLKEAHNALADAIATKDLFLKLWDLKVGS